MGSSNYGDYDKVDGEDTPWLSDSSEKSMKRPRSMRSSIFLVTKYFISALILLSMGFLLGWKFSVEKTQSRSAEEISHIGLFDGKDFGTHEHRFNGSFFRRSVYAGPPSPEMDEAWGRFTDTGSKWMPGNPAILNASAADVQQATSVSVDSAVKIPEDDGEGYMVTLEVFHQIHCLNMLRKYIHFDYYAEVQPHWANAPLRKEHSDHCVDTLLQALMCKSDLGLITYHWIDGYRSPMPDFSTLHSCRNPEAILQWTLDHQVHLTQTIVKQEKGVKSQLKEIF